VEARLLLVAILANRHERLYDEALDHAALARAAFPTLWWSRTPPRSCSPAWRGRRMRPSSWTRPLARSHDLDGVDPAVAGTSNSCAPGPILLGSAPISRPRAPPH